MAYKNKEDEKAARRKWNEQNPEKLRAIRERYNEKRREKRRDAEYRAVEAGLRVKYRRHMTPEDREVYLAERRAYQRQWHKEHYAETRARHKERMKNDPEYAARQKELWTAKAARLKGIPRNETPEQRENRLRKNREYNAKKYREKRLQEQLVRAAQELPKQVAPSPPPPPKPSVNSTKKKPGRLAALAGWYRF